MAKKRKTTRLLTSQPTCVRYNVAIVFSGVVVIADVEIVIACSRLCVMSLNLSLLL